VKQRLQRLQRLVAHAIRRESDVVRRLAEAQRAETQAQTQLRQLENYSNDYDRGRYGKPGESVPGRRLVESQRFLSNLEQVLAEQRRRVATLTVRSSDRRKVTQAARRRRGALEALLERYREDLKRQTRQQEQRIDDEFAARAQRRRS
jgi:flagellar export protein FliJ